MNNREDQNQSGMGDQQQQQGAQQRQQGQSGQMDQQGGQSGQQGGQMGQQGGGQSDDPIIGRDERQQQSGAGYGDQSSETMEDEEDDLSDVEFESDMDDGEESRTGEDSVGR